MKGIVESLFMGLFLTALIIVPAMDLHLPPPEYDALENFNGNVIEITHNEKKRRWYVKTTNGHEFRNFFIPQNLCGTLSEKLEVGAKIQTKLYRRYWYFGDIRGWEISSGPKSIVSFNDSYSMQLGNLKDLSEISAISFIGMAIGWGFLVYSRKKERKNA